VITASMIGADRTAEPGRGPHGAAERDQEHPARFLRRANRT
jgi:hypothetical protein